MKEPKVSIVIPLYNAESYLVEMIESIIDQTLKEIEIIPVDAGSTDQTLSILEKYQKKDRRIRVLHSERKSMGYQYNLGIRHATGKYVGFCEGDDYLASGMLETLYFIAEEKGVEFVKSDFEMFVDKGERLFLNYNILNGELSSLYGQVIEPRNHPEILYRDVNMWNGIYRRNFLLDNNIILNESPKAAFQDIGFVIQSLLSAKKAIYIKAETYKYRRDNMNSSVYDPKGAYNVVQEAEYAISFMNHFEREATVDAIVLNRYLSLFHGFFGRLPMEMPIEEKEGLTDRLLKCLSVAEKYVPYNARQFQGIEESLGTALLKEGCRKYYEFRHSAFQNEIRIFKGMFDYIDKYKDVVIFGAGESGASLCAMLLNNDFKGNIVFCDNNEKKSGMRILGKTVIGSSELLSQSFSESCLCVIAIEGASLTIRKQLLNMGINEERICRTVYILPHNAMEIRL